MFNKVTIKNYFTKAITSIKDISNLKKIAVVIVFVLSFLGSGYCALALNPNTFAKTLVSLITFFVSLLLFVLLANPNQLLNSIKKKRIDISLIIVLAIGFSVVLTMFINNDTSSLISYVGFGLNVVNGYLISVLIDYKKALFLFVKTVFYLTLAALFFWIVFLISRVFTIPFFTIQSTAGFKYINYFFISFQNSSSTRIQSVFWEPGLFSSFLILALVIQPYLYKGKMPIFQTIIFIIGIILTQSTFGYICLLIVFLFYLYKLVKKQTYFIIAFVAMCVCLIMLIAFYVPIINWLSQMLPSVFSKMKPGGQGFMSFSTRLYSPYVNILVFIQSPFVGRGIVGADNLYSTIIASDNYVNLVDSQTSTTFQLLSQFGIFGLIPTVFFIVSLVKIKIDTVDKIFIFVFFFLITNKEPHSGILIDWIIIFLFAKKAFKKESVSLLFDEIDEECFLQSFFRADDNSIVKRNSFLALIIKGGALIIGFIGAPIYNKFFSYSQTSYGTWLTLLSFLSWIMTFDLGMGNGLKNKLIQNDFLNNKEKSKELISSTYVFTIILSLAIFLIGSILIWTIDITFLFKNSNLSQTMLRTIVFIVFISICFEFMLKNVLYVLQALQKQALASFFSLISSISIVLFAAVVRINGEEKQLLAISIFYLFAINLPLILGTVYVFAKILKQKPIYFSEIKKNSFSDLFNLSIGFFIIQIALLFINSSNSILLSSNYGTEYSALYEYYSKFFIMLYSLFSMISLPYWAMIAKSKKDHNYVFIKKMIKQLIIYGSIVAFLGGLVLVFLQPIFDVWINDSLEVPLKANYGIGLLFFLNSLLLVYLSIIVTILNGLSEIKTQLIAFIIGAAVKIALFFLLNHFAKNNIGWSSAILSSVLALVPIAILLTINVINKMRIIRNEKN